MRSVRRSWRRRRSPTSAPRISAGTRRWVSTLLTPTSAVPTPASRRRRRSCSALRWPAGGRSGGQIDGARAPCGASPSSGSTARSACARNEGTSEIQRLIIGGGTRPEAACATRRNDRSQPARRDEERSLWSDSRRRRSEPWSDETQDRSPWSDEDAGELVIDGTLRSTATSSRRSSRPSPRRMATRPLADLSARVIKLERPGEGDFAGNYDSAVHGLASHSVWLNQARNRCAST